MATQQVALWKATSDVVVTDSVTDVAMIVSAAKQLRDRERTQIKANIVAGHYEVAASFIWHKTMALLKRQLATLGQGFIAELLQRPDIDEYADLSIAISDAEALGLAKDLGMITATQAMRLAHAQEVINHFASVDSDDELDDAEGMTPDETIGCLRVCVQGVLGQERVEVAENFVIFRGKLESETLTEISPELVRLQESPYFFIRTAVSILLSVLRAQKGAQLEHAARNASLIVPMFWAALKQPERWQIGQAYASEFASGKRESVKALHTALVSVRGFDYVPENLRSNTFTRVANSVISAHQGLNNFYNEPAPMRELANLGSSIPGPALAICITAVLCVKLGNPYGISRQAQSSADNVLIEISPDRWKYYLEGRLEFDRLILPKLTSDGPLSRWMEIVGNIALDPQTITCKPARDLTTATKNKQPNRVKAIASTMLAKAFA